MSAAKPLVVKAVWDEEAQVWVATSDDVPGLVTEAPSRDALVKKLKVMIPELLDENRQDHGDDIPFRLHEVAAVASKRAIGGLHPRGETHIT